MIVRFMTDFQNLGIPAIMLPALARINFVTPTPIQAQAIPVAMEGHDILGSAQTGTGKTASFAIPMISHLLEKRTSTALVLLPTRELAVQVLDAARKLLGNIDSINTALLIGGDSMVKQLHQLTKRPRLVVGTPGRVNDHLRRGSLKLGMTDFLVLDETDRMLDMGFGIQLNEIAKYLPEQRQTLMFSATMPRNINALSAKYLSNPVRIAVGEANAVAENIKQEIIKTSENGKYGDLVDQINIRNGSLLIFVKTKCGADRLATKLTREHFAAEAIHGDLRQTRRERVISDFRKQKFRILVATDIAARGLDIPHIENVVNYDLPQCPEDYIHRIGRTARAGADGIAINLLTDKDNGKWKEIYKLLHPTAKDKMRLSDMPCPISAEPLGCVDDFAGKKKKHRGKSNAENPFKPFAAEKKAKKRVKFNKNAGDYQMAAEEFGGAKRPASAGAKRPYANAAENRNGASRGRTGARTDGAAKRGTRGQSFRFDK